MARRRGRCGLSLVVGLRDHGSVVLALLRLSVLETPVVANVRRSLFVDEGEVEPVLAAAEVNSEVRSLVLVADDLTRLLGRRGSNELLEDVLALAGVVVVALTLSNGVVLDTGQGMQQPSGAGTHRFVTLATLLGEMRAWIKAQHMAESSLCFDVAELRRRSQRHDRERGQRGAE